MLTVHDSATVRAAEAAMIRRVGADALMDRASTGLTLVAVRMLREAPGHVLGSRVSLLVGAGANGGDALFAGARLARRGVRVGAVLLAGDRTHAGGLAALRRAGGRVHAHDEPGVPAVLAGADLVLDGIVGIGGTGGLRPDAAALVGTVRRAGVPVLAVDLPSGVDADTGTVGPGRGGDDHVRATRTVTFGCLKPVHCLDPGAAACGPVELVDIGLGPWLPPSGAFGVVTAADVAAVPVPHGESQKYSRGVLGIRAGSAGYPGAAVLCTGGALAGPVGMVRFVGPDDVARAVVRRFPEVVAGVGRVQAWVVGPGLGDDRGAEVTEVIASGLPVLVDADGLLALGGRVPGGAPVLLTPHAGELARLLGVDRSQVEARRLEHAVLGAQRTGATVLLKGNTTVVASPDGRVRVADAGTPYLATAGAGDVLSGFAGALLAAGLDPLEAGALGAFLHGTAARRASGTPGRQIVAAEIAGALAATVASLR